eukprot:3990317-Lingulodinium_polyedra.AAC.1
MKRGQEAQQQWAYAESRSKAIAIAGLLGSAGSRASRTKGLRFRGTIPRAERVWCLPSSLYSMYTRRPLDPSARQLSHTRAMEDGQVCAAPILCALKRCAPPAALWLQTLYQAWATVASVQPGGFPETLATPARWYCARATLAT